MSDVPLDRLESSEFLEPSAPDSVQPSGGSARPFRGRCKDLYPSFGMNTSRWATLCRRTFHKLPCCARRYLKRSPFQARYIVITAVT